MEMAAAGLPLVASELQGLIEAVEPGETGFLFPPGDASELASLLARLLDDTALQQRMSVASRKMAVDRYAEQRQIAELAEVLHRER
jgi:glycosyltransferase involved in cell wall biosynthesis